MFCLWEELGVGGDVAYLAVLLCPLYRIFLFFERDTVRSGRKKGEFKEKGEIVLCSGGGGVEIGPRGGK
ncbi:MAG: hypothetical protein D3903_01340 [Candidatus Electrothrix sp. GM3_4]|nr:hypothetical protein [Candidatus Electrothrix sp. GM3_4]